MRSERSTTPEAPAAAAAAGEPQAGPPAESPGAARRFWEIDALRGLMLLLMTFTHLPTRLTDPLGQPFGFVSAAEGFVLLSAFVAGMVYTRTAETSGINAMRRAFWRRALKVYLSQAATLLFLFTIIRWVGLRIDQPAVKDLLAYYLAHPVDGFVYSLLLVYEPALLDILPMYIFFLLLSPWVLAFALRNGWAPVLAVSVMFWVLAQVGIGEWGYALAVRQIGLPVPYHEMGAFDAFAWQLIWFFGLWIGASRQSPGVRPIRFPKWVVGVAVVVGLVGFCWRHFGPTGQAAFGDNEPLNLLFDKWQLGPLRLLDLMALSVLALQFGPWLLARLPRPRVLESMGSASLPVFCAHLVAVLLVLAYWGGNQRARPWWGDALLIAAVFGSLYAVAKVTAWLDARNAERARNARRPRAA